MAKPTSLLSTFTDLGWQKWPIVMFAILSFAATAAGIAFVIPEAATLVVRWFVAILASASIQYWMLGNALEIARNGLSFIPILFCLMTAVPSMLFSYVSLYKIYAQNPRVEDARRERKAAFDNYCIATTNGLEVASGQLDGALKEALGRQKDEELGTRQRGKEEAFNKYLRAILAELRIDTTGAPTGRNRGIIFQLWGRIVTMLTTQQTQIQNTLREVTKHCASTDYPAASQQIAARLDRPLVNTVLGAAGYQALPAQVVIDSAAENSGATLKELLLFRKAIRDLRDSYRDPLILWPAFWAVFFDGTALLMALVVGIGATERFALDRVNELRRYLRAAGLSGRRSAYAVAARCHSAGRMQDRWFLDFGAVDEMGAQQQEVVRMMQDIGLAKVQRLRKRFSVASTARSLLLEAGAE